MPLLSLTRMKFLKIKPLAQILNVTKANRILPELVEGPVSSGQIQERPHQ